DTRVARSGALETGARFGVVPEAVDVVVDLRQTLIELDVAHLHFQVELRVDRGAQVVAERALTQRVRPLPLVGNADAERVEATEIVRRHAECADLSLHHAAHEVREDLRTARYLKTNLPAVPRLDHREVGVGEQVVDRRAVLDAGRTGRRRGGRCLPQITARYRGG